MKIHRTLFRLGSRQRAFSLVEVALALGVVGFALVGIVGALPVAMNNGRLSIAQTRAASIAGTIFAKFRAQPFSTVQYLDDSSAGTINLNSRTPDPTVVGDTSDLLKFYASFDEMVTTPSADARRLHFSTIKPANGPSYRIMMRFNNSPAGMLAPYQTTAGGVKHAQGNAIEISIFDANIPEDIILKGQRSSDVFRFDSVVANRSE